MRRSLTNLISSSKNDNDIEHAFSLRWPTSVKAKLVFSRRNFFCQEKTFFSRQNFLSQGKTFFLKAKLSFSRQNFFLKTKLSFSRQNFLSQGKTFLLKGKLFPQNKTLSGGNQKEINSMSSKSCFHGSC